MREKVYTESQIAWLFNNFLICLDNKTNLWYTYKKGGLAMDRNDKENKKITPDKNTEKKPLSENWPEEGIQDILDYIEEQGVYIRE